MDSIVSPLTGCCAWGGVCSPGSGCCCSGAVGTVSNGFCVFCCGGGVVCCGGGVLPDEGCWAAGADVAGEEGCCGVVCCAIRALPNSAHTRSGRRPCSPRNF